jgi:hypothetical protein
MYLFESVEQIKYGSIDITLFSINVTIKHCATIITNVVIRKISLIWVTSLTIGNVVNDYHATC